MNEELLVSLAEAMLNEGIDEDSIISVLSNLVEEQEELLPVSESCFNSIVDLTEAIINEASVGDLARAVENNLPKRKKQLADAIKATKAGWKEYEEQAKKHPEEESALYKKAVMTDAAASKLLDKVEHAQDLANLNLPKNSKVNANKLFKVAHKVANDREDKMMNAHKNGESAKQFVRRLNRSDRADNIVLADPVMSRVAESLIDEAISILEKVTVSRWKQAAKKVLKDRKQKGWGTDIERDIQRELHADEVAELPDSDISANRVLNAAKKVTKKRNNDYLQVDNKGYRYGTSDQQNEHARLAKRADKSYNLSHKN